MVSVQVMCDMALWNFQLSSKFLETMKTRKYKNYLNYLIFKAYVCLIQAKVYIHIQNTTSPLG